MILFGAALCIDQLAESSVHPTNSFTDYRVGVDTAGEYKVVLSSDEKRFGGHDRIDVDGKYFTTPMEWNGRKNWLQVRIVKSGTYKTANHTRKVYTPTRTALVLSRK